MPKNITEYLAETEKLNKKNKELQQQLQEAKETIDAIKAGNIDALVITDKKILKVYTEKTADKTYRILIEKMHEGAVTINEDGTIIYCNSYFANMVNLPLQRVIGIKFKNFIDDSSKESFEAFFKQGKEKVTNVEDYLYTNDGKAIPVLMSVNTFSLDNNFVLSIILTNLSTHNKNQEELKRRTWQLEQKTIELESVNKELPFQNEEKEKRAAELDIANLELAFQNDEKEKRAAELVIANKELAFQNEVKEKRAAELVIANKELAFQNEEKEKRAAELIIANRELKHAEDDIRKLNEELEQKVIERTSQLESANNELGSFSYSVSHDLRAPIRAINGYTRILMEDYTEKFDADRTKVLHSIMHNSKKMGELIDDLLAFSQLGRKQVTVSEINMNALVKLVREELLFEEGENIPEFNINQLPPAKGDQSLIKQVWINLISNAIKYSKYKPKTRIEIGAYEKGSLVVYYVKDYGAGFDMQYYDKLFGVFQRLHSQEEFEGTGIGLAIIKKIVHRHNGTVWAESKIDEGSRFYFSLPA